MHNESSMIKEKRTQANMTMQQLAERAGCSKGQLSNLENGNASIERASYGLVLRLAHILGVDFSQFVDLSKIKSEAKNKVLPDREIVVIKLGSVGNASQLRTQGFSADMPVIKVQGEFAASLSLDTFAVELADKSMMPEYAPLDQIVIDPGETPTAGDIVVAKIHAHEEAILRKYRPRANGAFELMPLNNDYPTELVKTESEGFVVGPVVRHIRDPRR